MKATIELSYLPSPATSPNARVHWSKRYKAVHQMREDTFMLAMNQQVPMFIHARVTLTFVVATHRRRDPDNWLAMCKGIIDGLVDAHVLKDDSSQYVEYAPSAFVVDRARAPRTIIEIEEAT